MTLTDIFQAPKGKQKILAEEKPVKSKRQLETSLSVSEKANFNVNAERILTCWNDEERDYFSNCFPLFTSFY